ncbi:MAG: hypothetical protein PHW58_01605 [Candidatus Methanofastidiosa archaeon]|jgi:hypothetical protein|nr:hypothetical protein [Candidatus Methanofastidiosa archaeon]MDD4280911.1 hypothetical protein [Candidatus Methanofastidiosa archaeon]
MITKERYDAIRSLTFPVNGFILNRARTIFDGDSTSITIRTDLGTIKKSPYAQTVFLDGFEVGALDLSRSSIGSSTYVPWILHVVVEGERSPKVAEWTFVLDQ